MTVTTKHQGRWTWTRITVLGLVIATLAILAILPVRQGAGADFTSVNAGFTLVSGAVLLITAGVVWRFGLAAHVWAAVLGFWLLLTNGWYTVVNIFGAADNVGVFIIEAAAALGGGITLFGAVRYLLARRRVVTVESTAGSAGNSRQLYRVLAGVAIAVQVWLLFDFFVMGLGWGGFWYLANLGQALAFLALAMALFWIRPLLVLPLPVVSLLLMQAFQAADPSLKTSECTPAELSAAAEFPPPAGSPTPQFQSEPDNGCIARFFNSTLTGDQILDHYRLAAENAGWEVEDPGGVLVEPGQEPPTEGTGSLSMTKDQLSAELIFEPAGEGPAQKETWVVLSFHEQ